jgi:hypothetical protein
VISIRPIEGFIPGNLFADYEAVIGLVDELSTAASKHAQCESGANFIGQAACAAEFSWNISFAVGRFAASTGYQLFSSHALSLGALLNLINTTLWAEGAVDSILTNLHVPRTFTIDPTASAPTTSTPPGSSGSGGVGAASISIGWGSNPAPSGNWMDIAFTNFPAGTVPWYCVEEGTKYGPYSTTLSSSTET